MTTHILAISGSLRSESSNSRLLIAAEIASPEGTGFTFYSGLGNLPHFNPDQEMQELPEAVVELRKLVGACDGILISSPEYAHGVPGSLKNALDWLVGGFEFVGKPIALLNPSPHSLFAHPQLLETVRVMSARVIEAASITLPLAGKKLSPHEIATDPLLGPKLKEAMAIMQRAMIEKQAE